MADNENGNASWQDWSRHVLAELKRLNGNIESIEISIGEIKTSLAVQDVFIQDAKDKDIMDQVSKNTLFRNNTNKLIWKIIGGTVISGGGITFLVNFLTNLGNSTAGGG